jgi:hypothetical protein
MWRYAIGRGDDDPARAAFVSEAQARLRAESTAERRREAARRGREAFLAKLRQQGVDIGRYFAELAAKGNAARWRKQDAAPPASEARDDGAQTEAGPPASEAAARVKQGEAAPAEVGAEARQAQAIAGAALATSQSVTGVQVPRAIATGVHRPGELPAHLL